MIRRVAQSATLVTAIFTLILIALGVVLAGLIALDRAIMWMAGL